MACYKVERSSQKLASFQFSFAPLIALCEYIYIYIYIYIIYDIAYMIYMYSIYDIYIYIYIYYIYIEQLERGNN